LTSPIAGSVLPIKRAEELILTLPGVISCRIIAGDSGAIEPPGQPAGPRTVTIAPGMTMAEIERAAIQAALAETKGNRRKAAEMLGIGERTMYRKLKDYGIPVG
jgi:DNA-binding NtrC family response regulator